MAMRKQLQVGLRQAVSRAGDWGVPVADIEKVVDEKVQPLLLKHLSRLVIPFVRRSGVRVVALEPGRVVCRMPLRGNVNHIGTMYAGALFTLAEFPGGPLMLATFGLRRFIPIVTELDLRFERAAKTDVTVELTLDADEAQRIEAATLAEGRADLELHGALTDAHGEVVARSRATYQMRPRRR